MLALALASLLAWQTAVLSKGWRAEMAARLKLSLEGPPVPNSPRPTVVAGPITETRPSAPRRDARDDPAERIDGRDHRPPDVRRRLRHLALAGADQPCPGRQPQGRSAGSRRATSWTGIPGSSSARPPASSSWAIARTARPDRRGRQPCLARPGLDRSSGRGRGLGPGSTPGRRSHSRGWVRLSDLPPESWGVWISQVELPILLGLANRGEEPLLARLRAVLGRLADNRPWTDRRPRRRPAGPAGGRFRQGARPSRGGRATRRGQRAGHQRRRLVGPVVPVPAAGRPPLMRI